MAMTIHRTEGRGSTLPVKRLLGDLYDLAPVVASQLSTFGKLGQTIALMIDEKRKVAAKDKRAQEILDAKVALQKEVDDKTTPVMEAMKAALPEGTPVDLGSFQQLAQAMVCQSELAKIAALDAQLDVLAIQHKDKVVDDAIDNLMGADAGSGWSPNPNTVYIVHNNSKQGWPNTAFAFEFGGKGSTPTIYQGSEEIVVDYGEFAHKAFTSKRALLKVHYVLNALSDRFESMFESLDDNYNGFAAITPKANPVVTEESLKDWQKANKVE